MIAAPCPALLHRPGLPVLLLVVALAGCARPPLPGDPEAGLRGQPYPDLVPSAQLRPDPPRAEGADRSAAPAADAALAARAANLRRRAAELRAREFDA